MSQLTNVTVDKAVVCFYSHFDYSEKLYIYLQLNSIQFNSQLTHTPTPRPVKSVIAMTVFSVLNIFTFLTFGDHYVTTKLPKWCIQYITSFI